MGFRTSFYHYPKEYINQLTPQTDEDGYSYIDLEDTKNHLLMYDVFTNSILDTCADENYMTQIFDNQDSNIICKMNKNQFANFIKYVLTKHVQYMKEHKITYDEFDRLKDELKDGYDPDKKSPYSNDYNHLRVIDKLISNQFDTNLTTDFYSADLTYFDDIINNPWMVSKSWGTQMCITNLIHIYHMMNWDEEEIIIEGC